MLRAAEEELELATRMRTAAEARLRASHERLVGGGRHWADEGAAASAHAPSPSVPPGSARPVEFGSAPRGVHTPEQPIWMPHAAASFEESRPRPKLAAGAGRARRGSTGWHELAGEQQRRPHALPFEAQSGRAQPAAAAPMVHPYEQWPPVASPARAWSANPFQSAWAPAYVDDGQAGGGSVYPHYAPPFEAHRQRDWPPDRCYVSSDRTPPQRTGRERSAGYSYGYEYDVRSPAAAERTAMSELAQHNQMLAHRVRELEEAELGRKLLARYVR
ncbi:hypothetical protein T492DRAFT_1018817 [Pavlovales sp. CCMP2436]|nr:hypothetical protein T492DRAFT_1018817 [Pavlovales sp. CCMP2436]